MDELIPVSLAAKVARVSRMTLRHRIREAGIHTFRDPLDRRMRLVRLADLARFRVPQPDVVQGGGPERAA